MKRIVSVFLSVLMLLCCVIPASATTNSGSIDSSQHFSKLDITPYFSETFYDISTAPNGSGFFFNIQDFESNFSFKYIDLLIQTDDINTRFYSASQLLSTVKIFDNLYRVYGLANSNNDNSILLAFEKHGSGTYLNVIRCEVSFGDYSTDHVPINYSLTGEYYREVVDAFSDTPVSREWFDIDLSGTLSDAGSISIPAIEPNINIDGSFRSVNETNRLITSYLYFSWLPYDRLDLYFYNNFSSLVDYAVYVGSVNVLSDIQTVTINNRSCTILSLDFSDLNRSTDNSSCYIRIRGYADLASNSSKQIFYIFNSVGFVKYSSNNFWPSWLTKIIDKLDNIFTGRGEDQTAADSFNDSVSDQSNELEDLTADLNSVTRPPLSDVNLSTSTMVDSGTIVLATSGLGSILSNSIILRVLLMALTFALAGFILFGKR